MDLLRKIGRRVTHAANLKPLVSRLAAPVASISFDDVPRSAISLGGRLLRERAVRGTYYVAGRFRDAHEDGLEYYRSGDLETLAAEGHEIGCHSFSHSDLTTQQPHQWAEEVRRNQRLLGDEVPGQIFSTFAYPYGEASLRSKLSFGARFAACRGIQGGVNHGLIDLSQLKAVGVEARRWRKEVIHAAIDAAVARTGWVIFFTHDVSAEPSPYGARPEMLAFVLDLLAEARIEVLPVKNALARTLGL